MIGTADQPHLPVSYNNYCFNSLHLHYILCSSCKISDYFIFNIDRVLFVSVRQLGAIPEMNGIASNHFGSLLAL
jgi:hypothetical protein